MISCRAAAATIFSLTRAPPPPLIRLSCGSTWSAPSIATSMDQVSSYDSSGMPALLARSAVSSDVGTPLIAADEHIRPILAQIEQLLLCDLSLSTNDSTKN